MIGYYVSTPSPFLIRKQTLYRQLIQINHFISVSYNHMPQSGMPLAIYLDMNIKTIVYRDT
jgi:hypothetical protein